jgi:hypothetical protein
MRKKRPTKTQEREHNNKRRGGETMYNISAGAPKLSQNNVQWNLFPKDLKNYADISLYIL